MANERQRAKKVEGNVEGKHFFVKPTKRKMPMPYEVQRWYLRRKKGAIIVEHKEFKNRQGVKYYKCFHVKNDAALLERPSVDLVEGASGIPLDELVTE